MARRCCRGSTLLLAASLLGCAAQREARVRRNWNAAAEGPSDGDGSGTPGRDGGDAEGPTAEVLKEGWERIEELLGRTTEVLLTAPSPEVLAELATKWCEVEPVPRETPWGDVRVCYLYPPVRVEGIALTLELSDSGVVGFVAPELDAAKSEAVAAEALAALGHLCDRSWTSGRASKDVQTCAVDGGSTLAVARLRPRPETDRWQVSVSILGAI